MTIDAGTVGVFAAAVTPFVPTEPVLIGAGALAATGHANLAIVVAVATAGCCISDHLLYFAARTLGGRAGASISRRGATRRLAEQLSRWGPGALVIGRWLPGGGTVAALLAGTLRWPLARFTPASALGCALWSSYAVLLGYLGGTLTDNPLVGLLGSLLLAVAIALAIHHFGSPGCSSTGPATRPPSTAARLGTPASPQPSGRRRAGPDSKLPPTGWRGRRWARGGRRGWLGRARP